MEDYIENYNEAIKTKDMNLFKFYNDAIHAPNNHDDKGYEINNFLQIL